jgi:protein ImuB
MQKNALRLAAVDEAAAREGLAVGMTLADARARTPQVAVAHAEPAADRALLTRLGEACRRYTPALALHAPDGLDLDLTGCAALFGGEAPMMTAMLRRMQGAGLAVRAAVADAPAQAYALARFGAGGIVPVGAGQAALSPLPVAALGLDPAACAVLRGLGLYRVEQILPLPRAALAKRLGSAMLDRLDQALGRRADPLQMRLERPPFLAERRLLEPICEGETVLRVAGDLAADLAQQLEARGLGGRRFGLELFRVDGAIRRLAVAAGRPLRDPARIVALFTERLAGLNDGLEADFGFDQLRLAAEVAEPMDVSTSDALAGPAPGSGLADLADRIAARTGAVARRAAPADRHRPEHADVLTPLRPKADWSGEAPLRFEDAPLRPLRLFDPPEPIVVAAAELPEGPPARFTWRRVSRTVVRAEGPERIEAAWGRNEAEAPPRDYYRLEDEVGRRYWVFRQGHYRADAEPLWRLHGLFG